MKNLEDVMAKRAAWKEKDVKMTSMDEETKVLDDQELPHIIQNETIPESQSDDWCCIICSEESKEMYKSKCGHVACYLCW